VNGALVAGLIAGYGIAVPVGAVGAYLVTLSARTTPRTGVCAALGVATADGLYALLAVLGGSALAGLVRPFAEPLRWVSALVLLVLALLGAVGGVRAYRARQAATRPVGSPTGPGRVYLTLLGVTLLNPMTVLYFAALVLGSRSAGDPGRWEQAVFVLAAFAASASWQLLLAGGGVLLGRVLTGRRGRLATALASSALVAVLAVRTMRG
jgi:arginine exporter protein ArgO